MTPVRGPLMVDISFNVDYKVQSNLDGSHNANSRDSPPSLLPTYPDPFRSSGAEDDVVRIGREAVAAFDVLGDMIADQFQSGRVTVATYKREVV